jgi:hypothetical protein
LKHFECIGSGYPDRAEMGDIKHDRIMAAGVMLGESPFRIGKGHLPTTERDDFGAKGTMNRIKRRETIRHVPTLPFDYCPLASFRTGADATSG